MVLAVAGTLTVILFFGMTLYLTDFVRFGHSQIALAVLPSPSRLFKFKSAVVSSDAKPCSKVGR